MSNDFGDTWTASASLSTVGPRQWNTIAISTDGKYQTACLTNGQIYRSTDFGTTWNIVVVLPYSLDGLSNPVVEISGDGRYQLILMRRVGEAANVYVSTDYGVSWSARTPTSTPLRWGSAAMSDNGKIQVIANTENSSIVNPRMCISFNWGTDWTDIPLVLSRNKLWADVVMSADGKILAALERNDGVYRSFADSSFNGGLLVTDTIRASAVYGIFYGDASNLIAPGVGIAGTIATQLTGDGSTRTFSISSSYNGLDEGRYIVSVGGIDQPPGFWNISPSFGGRLTFVDAPRAGEVISIRALVGNGYPTLYSFRTNTVGYGQKTFITTTDWNAYEPGIAVSYTHLTLPTKRIV